MLLRLLLSHQHQRVPTQQAGIDTFTYTNAHTTTATMMFRQTSTKCPSSSCSLVGRIVITKSFVAVSRFIERAPLCGHASPAAFEFIAGATNGNAHARRFTTDTMQAPARQVTAPGGTVSQTRIKLVFRISLLKKCSRVHELTKCDTLQLGACSALRSESNLLPPPASTCRTHRNHHQP